MLRAIVSMENLLKSICSLPRHSATKTEGVSSLLLFYRVYKYMSLKINRLSTDTQSGSKTLANVGL